MALSEPVIDKGFAWVILFAGTFAKFLASAQSLGSLGPMFVEFLAYYEVTKTEVSWLGAIQLATVGGGGIIIGPLVRRFGARKVVLSGTAVSVCGLLLSTFTNSFYQLYITYAFMTGIGGMCQTLCAIVVVSMYFKKRRALAMGVVFVGASAANMLSPLLVVWLVHHFGLRGTFLLMAGLQMQAFWLGALMRPQPVIKTAINATKDQETCTLETLPLSIEEGLQNGEKDSVLVKTNAEEGVDRAVKTDPVSRIGGDNVILESLSCDLVDSQVQNHYDERTAGELTVVEEKTNAQQHHNGPSHVDAATQDNNKPKKMTALAEHLGLSILSDRAYLMTLLGTYLECLGHVIPFAYLPLRGVSSGASEARAALLLTLLSVAGFVTRPLVGLVGDKLGRWRGHLMGWSLCVTGAISVLFSFLPSFFAVAAYAVLFGICAAIYIVLINPANIDLFGLERIAIITGHGFVTYGLACFTALPLAGWLIETSSNSALPFLIGGAMQILGGCCWFIAISIKRRQLAADRETLDRENDSKEECNVDT